jgi:hypothetical protein
MGKAYPLDFVRSFPGIEVSDIEFGWNHGLIEAGSAKLSHLYPVARITTDTWTDHHQIWRAIALKWALTHCAHDDQHLFDEVNSIYAEFNSPDDMKNIVSYLPGDDQSSPRTLRQKIFDFYQTQLFQISNLRQGSKDRV